MAVKRAFFVWGPCNLTIHRKPSIAAYPTEVNPAVINHSWRLVLKRRIDAIDDLLGVNEASPSPTDLYNTIYYKWFGSHAGDVGYTGNVIDAEIPNVWYDELVTTTNPTTTEVITTTDPTTTTIPVLTPGFSLPTIFCLLLVFISYKKKLE